MRNGLTTIGVAFIAALVLASSGVAQGPEGEADLAVTKSDSPDPVGVGGLLTYTIQVQNLGPAPATDTTITDQLPETVQLVSASGAACDLRGINLKCELGTLVVGEVRTVTVQVRPGEEGPITNTVTATSNEPDTNQANNEANATTQVGPPGTTPPGPPPGAGQPTCFDVRPTIVGTPGPDLLVGGPGRDVILAKGGNDLIGGLGDADLICAGRNEDFVRSGGGDDRVKGGAGNDRIRGQDGDDIVRGNGGNDRLRGNRGNDTLVGGPGKDRCSGGPGKDIVRSC